MSSPAVEGREEGVSAVVGVAEFNARVARLLERSIPLIWVTGEVSNLTRAASGHWYFSLKDASAQVRCVMFRNSNRLIDWNVANGDQIDVRAIAGLYVPRGEFQLTVESMRRAGAGALYEAFLRTKAKLEGLGLFDELKKRPVPVFPGAVGVVTSLQAAALRDVLTTLARRSPHLRVVLYPAPVQGRDAPRRLVEAITRASQRAVDLHEIDVLIVVRGGGSIEDLAAFNDEGVAHAIARCSVPVVSGVGHETDVTIADFVADLRAPTPTAAAELVSPDGPRIIAHLRQQSERARRFLARRVNLAEQRLDDAQRRLKSPLERLKVRAERLGLLAAALGRTQSTNLRQRAERFGNLALHLRRARIDVVPLRRQLDHLVDGASQSLQRALQIKTSRLELLNARLALLDPNAALERGYAIVEDADGRILDDAIGLVRGDRVTMRFRRGSAEAIVEKTGESKER